MSIREVLAALRHIGIGRMRIFLLGTHLFMYYEAPDTFNPERHYQGYGAFAAWDPLDARLSETSSGGQAGTVVGGHGTGVRSGVGIMKMGRPRWGWLWRPRRWPVPNRRRWCSRPRSRDGMRRSRWATASWEACCGAREHHPSVAGPRRSVG